MLGLRWGSRSEGRWRPSTVRFSERVLDFLSKSERSRYSFRSLKRTLRLWDDYVITAAFAGGVCARGAACH